MALKGKSTWVLVLFILAGIVLGGFLGDMLAPYSFWSWLSYGKTFGIETVTLNLSILTLTFGLQIKIDIKDKTGNTISCQLFLPLSIVFVSDFCH